MRAFEFAVRLYIAAAFTVAIIASVVLLPFALALYLPFYLAVITVKAGGRRSCVDFFL